LLMARRPRSARQRVMTRLALRISKLSELRCEEQVSKSILEFSYSISLTDDI
jgi:hypothetical protein